MPQESTTLETATFERRREPNRDHRTICKFRGAEDLEWQELAKYLIEAASAAIGAVDYSPTMQRRQAMLTEEALERQGLYYLNNRHNSVPRPAAKMTYSLT